MIKQNFGYSFNEQVSGFGYVEYSDTQAYPKVTFQVVADHPLVKDKVISYLSKPRTFYVPAESMYVGAGDTMNKVVAPNVRIDYFQVALREMNAALGIALR